MPEISRRPRSSSEERRGKPQSHARARRQAAASDRPITTTSPTNPFHAVLESVKPEIDARLAATLDERMKLACDVGSEVTEMVEALQDLCQRGGKRMRPALVLVGAQAATNTPPFDAVYRAGVALELLQAYFLIHDDWMDQDVERRGGPTVHVSLARRYRSRQKGAISAILAGDYAVGLATDELSHLELPGKRASQIFRCFAEMQLDAVAGQQLDVIGRTRDPERTYRLKTASYTVKGPLLMGAILAGGSARLLHVLEKFSIPAGIAFQLRDDQIGTFGDPELTGKPRGGDLTAGKRTAIVEYALRRLRGANREVLLRVLGNTRGTERQVERAITVLEETGAREHIEARIHELGAEALALIDDQSLSTDGRRLLQGAIDALTRRQA